MPVQPGYDRSPSPVDHYPQQYSHSTSRTLPSETSQRRVAPITRWDTCRIGFIQTARAVALFIISLMSGVVYLGKGCKIQNENQHPSHMFHNTLLEAKSAGYAFYATACFKQALEKPGYKEAVRNLKIYGMDFTSNHFDILSKFFESNLTQKIEE